MGSLPKNATLRSSSSETHFDTFFCFSPFRSPPRPSPGSLHYSDEDVSVKYNDLVPAESSSLTEKPSEVSDSQVIQFGQFIPVGWCHFMFEVNIKSQFTMFTFIYMFTNMFLLYYLIPLLTIKSVPAR